MTYLIKFDENGRRSDTYVAEEKTQEQVTELLEKGFVLITEKDYQLLIGNVDGKEYIRNADGTYSEYDLDGTSNPQSIEKWEVNGDVITLIEDEYEQYDLKVLEISSNKLVLEFHDKDEASEHYAKMTYKRG